jgi:predicted RNase H-like nuclease (RuvC/YqgF family)
MGWEVISSMGSDRYLLKRFGLLGFLFGGKRGEETPDSQSAVEQPPTGQPVGGQDLAEAIKKLLDEAYEESGSPTVNIGMWQELRSLMEKDDSVKGAIKAAQEGNYDEMCNHLEELKSELEKFASQPKVNPGLERIIQCIKSKIDELIRKAREKSLHKR